MANSIIPLIILLLVVALFSAIGFAVYTIAQDVSSNTRAKMEKRNISFSKEGMKVSVKEKRDEEYKDQTQSVLVKVWNNTSFPAYKSRLWDNGASGKEDDVKRR
ncbi:conserved hypothetical protein [Talaromyces stipitatus ATCC 10500]|uniref:Uncharacterized protein n=1 Tax=Talaromyces stipitatus (strain ATCC 10500 / CBS 375.48 / QM 6759 / NRRL 1006) TaxID=441959 RepID=B8LUQ8_TALSN|nr:uncharacterized protein TSTA_073050 [Talaromyces stipitatus ATCC 10500]EED23915.1 conserved hypothetical protein [Talaromyces stipitatus ATCC 10500]